MFNNDTKISELTVGELTRLITEVVGNCNQTASKRAFGIQGLADLFGVSYSQAKRIKQSGVVDKAITQRGRMIIIDKEKALQLFSSK